MVVGIQLQDKVLIRESTGAVWTHMVPVVRILFLAKLWNPQCMLTHGFDVETSVLL